MNGRQPVERSNPLQARYLQYWVVSRALRENGGWETQENGGNSSSVGIAATGPCKLNIIGCGKEKKRDLTADNEDRYASSTHILVRLLCCAIYNVCPPCYQAHSALPKLTQRAQPLPTHSSPLQSNPLVNDTQTRLKTKERKPPVCGTAIIHPPRRCKAQTLHVNLTVSTAGVGFPWASSPRSTTYSTKWHSDYANLHRRTPRHDMHEHLFDMYIAKNTGRVIPEQKTSTLHDVKK